MLWEEGDWVNQDLRVDKMKQDWEFGLKEIKNTPAPPLATQRELLRLQPFRPAICLRYALMGHLETLLSQNPWRNPHCLTLDSNKSALPYPFAKIKTLRDAPSLPWVLTCLCH